MSDRDTKFLSHFWLTLGTLLGALIKKNIKAWGELLPHAEFAFNWAPSKAMGLSPFQIVYGQNSRAPLDLIPIPTPTKFSWEVEKRSKMMYPWEAYLIQTIIAQTNKSPSPRIGCSRPHGLWGRPWQPLSYCSCLIVEKVNFPSS